MLPAPYFHVTITVPAELRETLRANQRDGYAVLMKAAAEAIIELARDPRYVGATVGVLAVSHTPGPSSSSTTLMSTAWSPAAASPRTAGIGIRHATASSFQSRPRPALVRWPRSRPRWPSAVPT